MCSKQYNAPAGDMFKVMEVMWSALLSFPTLRKMCLGKYIVVKGTTKILHNGSESGSGGHVIQPCLYMRRSIQSHMPGTSAFAFVM